MEGKAKLRDHKTRANKPVLDEFDVREWFAKDPADCVQNKRAQAVLRSVAFPLRWWVEFPDEERVRDVFLRPSKKRIQELLSENGQAKRANIERSVRERARIGAEREFKKQAFPAGEQLRREQHCSWWQGLRHHLDGFLHNDSLAECFADYLAGFLLVLQNETPRSFVHSRRLAKNTAFKKRPPMRKDQIVAFLQAQKDKPVAIFQAGTLLDDPAFIKPLPVSNTGWRRLKKLIGIPASAEPPHLESLKTRLTKLMTDALVVEGFERRVIAERFVPKVWAAIGEKATEDSCRRADQRSRHRSKALK